MERRNASPASLYARDGRRKYLTPAERLCFVAAARAQPRAELETLCLVLAYTGCRISEALSPTASAFERGGGFVAIRSLKKRGRLVVREVPVPYALLDRIVVVHDLPHADSDHRLWRWSRGRAWFLVKRIMRAAGIQDGPHMTAKGLRHGFGIHAIGSGVPLNLVQRWLGHANIATTAIYTEALGVEERAIAERMWRAPVDDLRD